MARVKKIWKVRCPFCGNSWEFRDDKLKVGPKYRYCKKCEKSVAELGQIAFRVAKESYAPRKKVPQE